MDALEASPEDGRTAWKHIGSGVMLSEMDRKRGYSLRTYSNLQQMNLNLETVASGQVFTKV